MGTAAQWQDTAEDVWQTTGRDSADSLQQVAADRLAAHRQRRAAAVTQEAESEARTRQQREAAQAARRLAQRRGASQVREAVAARYEQRESYREFLAAEAERAIAQAQAEAEVANRNAQAVAEAQMALLDELDQFKELARSPREQALVHQQDETRGELAHALADIVLGARELMAERPLPGTRERGEDGPGLRIESRLAAEPAIREVSSAGLTVRLFEDMPATPSHAECTPHRGRQHFDTLSPYVGEDEVAETLNALEDEIDFRRAPVFSQATAIDMQPIPGNLIEFPRELVAPRRARPRLAEGPLRDESGRPQLRIFEVEPEQMTLPETMPLETHLAPEWQSLQLGGFEAEVAPPSSASDAQTHLALPLHTAPMERRLMSAAVDLCCVGAAWVATLTCVSQIAGPALWTLPPALAAVSAVSAFALLGVFYQLLFFTFAEGTPGMRYARIALCTFGEGNPSRQAMRRRVLSSLLAACPLGLGLAWALLDADGLGWHDRMSRMYQRAY